MSGEKTQDGHIDGQGSGLAVLGAAKSGFSFVALMDLNVGRNPKEVLRVLDALQTDELCPCNWSKGEDTIDLNEATQ